MKPTICSKHNLERKRVGARWVCRECKRNNQKCYYNRHRAEISERVKAYKKRVPKKAKKWSKNQNIKNKYGLTLKQVKALLRLQNNTCALCKKPFLYGLLDKRNKKDASRRIEVDHSHVTGDVRGLLHGRCNRLLGHSDDDIDLLRKAIDYINYCDAATCKRILEAGKRAESAEGFMEGLKLAN